MKQLVEVSFKGNRKDFYYWEREEALAPETAVIVEADRGEDLGYVYAVGETAAKRNAGTPHGYGASGPLRGALRIASRDDVTRAQELRASEPDTRQKTVERVRANSLVMKVSDAEWQWDRKKLTIYFTAERRVDFRTLVRELASMFRARIELKQIGVRDEAKRLDGIGRCGRQYCSASWLPELRPVNLGVAKDQRLSLNPSQISGACGRLMCCLRYEHDFYVAARRRFPKEGKVLATAVGDEKVIANDIFRERVTLRGEDGETRIIPLAELSQELQVKGIDLPFMRAAAVERDVEATTEDEAALEAGEESDPLDGSVVVGVAEPDGTAVVVAETETSEAPAEDRRRSSRRRGRRGGRRGRQSGPGDPNDPASPPTEHGES